MVRVFKDKQTIANVSLPAGELKTQSLPALSFLWIGADYTCDAKGTVKGVRIPNVMPARP